MLNVQTLCTYERRTLFGQLLEASTVYVICGFKGLHGRPFRTTPQTNLNLEAPVENPRTRPACDFFQLEVHNLSAVGAVHVSTELPENDLSKELIPTGRL